MKKDPLKVTVSGIISDGCLALGTMFIALNVFTLSLGLAFAIALEVYYHANGKTFHPGHQVYPRPITFETQEFFDFST